MSAGEPNTLLDGFQWLVIPHGMKGGKLRISVRVMPQLHEKFFKKPAQDKKEWKLADISDEIARKVVLDWPDFLSRGVKLQLAATSPDTKRQPDSANKKYELDLTAEWRKGLEKQGARAELAAHIWKALFFPGLSVEFGKSGNINLHASFVPPKQREEVMMNYLAALPHAAGANILRNAFGEIYANGLASAGGGASAARTAGKARPAGEISVALDVPQQGTVQSLINIMIGLGAPAYSRGRMIFPNQNFGPLFKWCRDRLAASGFQFSDDGIKLLNNRISSWPLQNKTKRDSIVTAGTPAEYTLAAFFIDRMLALAPELAKLREDAEAAPEFHRELGKLAFHPWLLETLGLAIQTEIDPELLQGGSALYVSHVDTDAGPITPAIQTRVVCNSGGDYFTKERSPDERYYRGCVRLAVQEDCEPAFVLEQLDIDAAAEKIFQAAQSMKSQFESGVGTSERKAVLASLPTTGISLLMKKPSEKAAQAAFERIKRLDCAVHNGVEDCYAEDLIIGFRPDIAPLAPDELGGACYGQWKSLVGRRLDSLVMEGSDWAKDFDKLPQDEAIITTYARVPVPNEGDKNSEAKSNIRLHFEEVFRWRGWSLAAPPVECEEAFQSLTGPLPALVASYQAAGGLPKQRIGWGYVVGMRVVYADGRSISLDEAKSVYDSNAMPACKLGTSIVGSTSGADYFMPFFRYEPIQPPDVHLRERLNHDKIPTERSDYLTVASSGTGELLVRATERALVPPRIDLEAAIRMGMFDEEQARRVPPEGAFVGVELNSDGSFPGVGHIGIAKIFGFDQGGETCYVETEGAIRPNVPYLPDPWARRLIIGIYRRADDMLMGFEYFDYYEDGRKWPDCRRLLLRVEGVITETLRPEGYEVEWHDAMLVIKVVPGMALRLRIWHEMTEQMLADSGVIEAMANYLNNDADCRAALGIADCCDGDLNDVRDRLIRCMSRWHERFSSDLKPYLVSGRPARDINLTSFSMLNPVKLVEAVHVVPVPVRAPHFSEAEPLKGRLAASLPTRNSFIAQRFEVLRENRGETVCKFAGDIEFHRASTARLECIAAWDEVTDEQGTIFQRNHQRHPMFSIEPIVGALDFPNKDITSELPPDNDLLLLKENRTSVGRVDNEDIQNRVLHYDFGDAKARLVNFSLRATSRFLKDFPENRLSKVRETGPETSRWVKATMPPAPPVVAYVVPLLESIGETRDNARIQRRQGGWFRVWLERPWYTSGDGELLALVCWPPDIFRPRGGAADYLIDKARAWGTLGKDEVPDRLSGLYTGWGLDPIWEQSANLKYIPPGAFSNRLDVGVVQVVPSQLLQGDKPCPSDQLGLALYKPLYHERERRWYADIHIQPEEEAYFPFVRLALARYQPNAIEGCELSEIVTSEFIQLLPERSASVRVQKGKSEKASSFVHITISGPSSLTLSVPTDVGGSEPAHHNRIVMRVDESRSEESGAYMDTAPVWIPIRNEDAEEEIPLEYADGRWLLPKNKPLSYKFETGVKYSIYLEERQVVLLDKEPMPPPGGKVFPYPPDSQIGERVVYVDRVILPT